jgi:hypothetical protein
VPAPNQPREQILKHLDIANTVRIFRSELKKDIKAGKISIPSLLENPPDEIKTMTISSLLIAMPRVGQSTVNKLLIRCQILPSKTIDGLTSRQRDALVAMMYRL